MFSGCPICQNSKCSLIYKARLPIREYIGEFDTNYGDLFATIKIVKCCKCGHAYIQNNKGLEDFDYYSDAPIPAKPVNPEMGNKLLQLLEWIGKGYFGDKKVIEIGSGSGHLARNIAQQTKSVTIVEPNKSLNKYLLPEENINLISENYKYDHSMGLFDLVICRQVIEHIQNPINFLNEIKKCLKPDGFAYLEVPSAEYIYTNNMIWDFHLQHIHYFTFNSFLNAAEQTGLYLIKDCSLMGKHDMGFLFSNNSLVQKDRYYKKNNIIFSETGFSSVKNKFKLLLNSINGSVALYGANTHGQVFFNIFNDYSNNIELALDDSKYLYNYFLFNNNKKIAIQNPRSIEINQFGNIIITAYLHEKSIRKNLNELGYEGRIYSINPNSIN